MARVQTAKRASHASSKQFTKQPQKDTKQIKPDKKGAQTIESKGKSPEKPKEQRDSFRDEIIALGGDDEDYELLKDIDSDEDIVMTGSGKKDVMLSKDLEKFMKGLNFSSVKPKDIEEAYDDGGDRSEEETEADEEDEEAMKESESESDEGASEAPSRDAAHKQEKKDVKQNITIPKVGPNSRLLFEPTPQWYTLFPPLPPNKTQNGPPSPQTLTQKQSHASSLHASELAAYENATSASKLTASSSDAAFLQRILTSGTLSDRLSALTLLAQSSPVHNTRALETLRGMANKKGREESLKALRAICDWWVGGGAPDRKLKYFVDQPLSHPGATDKYLLLWHFEDWLKKYFYTILQTLETLSLDPLPYVRLQAMALIFTLLRDKPEQEQNLLRLLVNKLGDSERSVASRASYHLLQLLQAHPSMKAVVVREISSLTLKPARGSTATAASSTKTASGATHLKFADTPAKATPKPKGKLQDKYDKKDLQQEHSRYYASVTLNQIMLSTSETDRAVARQLINLYFELFKEILGTPGKSADGSEKGDSAENAVDHSRYAKEKRKRQEEKKGKEKTQADHEGFAEVEDSNSKLISAILTGVNRALPFAKLSLEDVEFSKHIDTLFLISHKSTFNISLQALRLIMQICQSLGSTPSTSSSSFFSLSTSITDRYYRALYASLHDTRLNSSNKHAMYLNLLLKSLKVDTKPERVKAFVRRFVQLLVGAGNGGAEFIAGGLYLLGELFKAQPTLMDLLRKPREATSEDDGDEYDPKKRDPQYANAGASPLWELTPLLSHYHPTIRLHASQLLSGAELTANADLSLNTLSHFLDRFVYKNPKKLRPKGPSAMQPGAASSAQDGTSIRIVKGAVTDGAVINDERFWKKDVKDVPVDQVFFHKYFSKKNEKERAKAEKIAKRKGDEDVEGDSDEEEEEGEEDKKVEASKSERGSDNDEDESEGEAEIWEALKATNPDLNPDLDGSDEEVDLSSDDSDEDGDEDSEGSASKGEEQVNEEEQEGSDADSEMDDEAEVGKENGDGEDSDGALSLAEASDAEDLISLADVKFPDVLITYDGGEDEEEWEGFGSDSDSKGKNDKKRKRVKGNGKAKEEQKKKRRKLRSLPTFATYEDYAKLIEGEPEDNI